MYFRSLAVFALAACATFVNAAPAPSSLELVAVRASADLDLAMRDIAADTAVAVAARADAPAAAAPAAPSDPSKIIQNMTIKLTPIVNDLKAAVADKSNLNKEQIVGYLNDITTILKDTRTDLQAIAKNPSRFVANVLTHASNSATLGPFIPLIVSVLRLLLQVVDTPLGSIVTPMANEASNALQDVIVLVVGFLPEIRTLLNLPLLTPILRTFQLDQLLSIINAPHL